LKNSLSEFLKNQDELLENYKRELDDVKSQVKNAILQEIEKAINIIFANIFHEFENRVKLVQEEVSEPTMKTSLEEVFKSLFSDTDLDMKTRTDKLINSMGFAESSSELNNGSIDNIVQMIVTLKQQKTESNFKNVSKVASELIGTSLEGVLSKSLLPKIAKLSMNSNNKSVEMSDANISSNKSCSDNRSENRQVDNSTSQYRLDSHQKEEFHKSNSYQKKFTGSKQKFTCREKENYSKKMNCKQEL
jgi:hypothetical protein